MSALFLHSRFCVSLFAGALIFLAGCTTAIESNSAGPEESRKVLTGTQVTYSLTSAMVAGTDIEVINVPTDGRRFATLKDYIERRQDQFAPLFESADAVVSMTNALPSDPLFRFARQANIHLINIDAAQPWSYNTNGVSVVEAPVTSVDWAPQNEDFSEDSPYFWLSLSNAIRMTDIVGSDLARLFPDSADQIIANRNQLKNELLALSRGYQDQLIEVEDITVFALANEFVYLTNDLGLFVDDYFIKQDINWTEEDLQNLTEHLESLDISVVLHKWLPSDAIQQAIESAGATLVVLDTADPGMSADGTLVVDGYQQILRKNLDSILQALQN